uniref:Uncharacterized protein n=1 Tax=Paramoeba aestuarina TaxID=180227 RepID=A0A7S4US15_9EUKA
MTFHGIDIGFRLVETIEELLKRPDCVSKFDVPHVREIFSGLVEKILDQKLSRHPNLTKQLNVLGFYLIQNSSIEVCISALLLELSAAMDSYIQSVSSYNTKIIEFTCKCLQKVSQRFSRDVVLDIRRILRASENYFQRFPPSQFPGKNNTPVTSIRHIITELVNCKGKSVLTECVSLNMQQTLAYQFVEMAVKNNEVNEYMHRAEITPQRQHMGAEASDGVSSEKNSETLPSADVIHNVFASIKRLNQTEEGIKELFKLLKEHPQMNILSHMNALNTSHRIYCVRRLHRLLQADIASGLLPKGYVLNIPKPEDLKVAPP